MNRNRVELIGRVGQQPEIVTFDNGNKIAKFSMATTEKWKDKNTGEKKESTEWHNVVVNGRLVEIVEKYINKGDLISVVGKIKTRSYGEEGNKKYVSEIHCAEILMFPSKKSMGTVDEPNLEHDVFSGGDDDLPF
jgi:single-strand DNA-binding protein